MSKLKYFTQERIDEISAGYDLDGGGYAFEEIRLPGMAYMLQWEDPELSLLPWMNDCPHPKGEPNSFYQWSCPVYVFGPESSGEQWPEEGWRDSDGDAYILRGHGMLQGSDRTCHCEGKSWCSECSKLVDGTRCVDCGSPTAECQRCEDGYLDSPGGAWALYSIESEDERAARLMALCTFELICHPEDEPIEGNASAIDEETDRKAEQWIYDQLDGGNQWAWCCVEVKCSWQGFAASDSGTGV